MAVTDDIFYLVVVFQSDLNGSLQCGRFISAESGSDYPAVQELALVLLRCCYISLRL